jgi:rubrerythrin
MNETQFKELMLQSLEHERGGVLIYRTALDCVQNEELKEEWEEYLEQTENHVRVLTELCGTLGIDPTETTPGVQVVTHTGKSLVMAMKMALAAGDPAAAELVACECVVLAETKDHADWELIGMAAKALDGKASAAVKAAFEKIEDEEDEHLYHTKGWCRELWLKSLGLKATLPPPEEQKDVRSAAAAAKARKDMGASQSR